MLRITCFAMSRGQRCQRQRVSCTNRSSPFRKLDPALFFFPSSAQEPTLSRLSSNKRLLKTPKATPEQVSSYQEQQCLPRRTPTARLASPGLRTHPRADRMEVLVPLGSLRRIMEPSPTWTRSGWRSGLVKSLRVVKRSARSRRLWGRSESRRLRTALRNKSGRIIGVHTPD